MRAASIHPVGELSGDAANDIRLLDQSNSEPMEVPQTRLALHDVLSGKQAPHCNNTYRRLANPMRK